MGELNLLVLAGSSKITTIASTFDHPLPPFWKVAMVSQDKLRADREILEAANAKGTTARIGAWMRLSGPGWLQSAITLGGGSLLSALYLGVLGGTSFLWLQIVAIFLGVVMLSAISYVTLTTGIRPFRAINAYVNPVLGVGWVVATVLANMIFILPQFSLCFDTVSTVLLPEQVPSESVTARIVVSSITAVLGLGLVILSVRGGRLSRFFDLLLKLIVAAIVVCFVIVTVWLWQYGHIDWSAILMGLVPDPAIWWRPAPELAALIETLPEAQQTWWQDRIVAMQRNVMISATTTAVGINMTFLLPYSMLARGWDKPFRGLSRFDLITALGIPYLLVTSCIVIAAANAFHAKADEALLSEDSEVVLSSTFFNKPLQSLMSDRMTLDGQADNGADDPSSAESSPGVVPGEPGAEAELSPGEIATYIAGMPSEERILAAALVKPSSNQLAAALSPLFGEGNSGKLVFGLGALAMGFSTLVILMLINGYAVAEVLGDFRSPVLRIVGAALACASGFCWVWLWAGESRTWLTMVASSFAAVLLPIAYLAFFLLMNNARLLGDAMPRGLRRVVWNTLMLAALAGAFAQATLAASEKIRSSTTGGFVAGGLGTFALLMLFGFGCVVRNNQMQEQDDG